MARIPYCDTSKYSPRFVEVLNVKHPMNIYRMLAHAGPVGEGFMSLGYALLREGVLDARLREIVVLRVGRISKASYEVHQHTRIGRKAGLSDAQMAALKVGAEPELFTPELFSPQQQLAIRFTDEMVAKVKASDELFAAMNQAFSPAEVAELTVLVGYYMMVCRFLETFEVDIESA
jgi:4-carboxymuconolactone decarboxylase